MIMGPGCGDVTCEAAGGWGVRSHGHLGEHPGAGTATDADLGFPLIRATVAPAPYDAYAATQYRRH